MSERGKEFSEGQTSMGKIMDDELEAVAGGLGQVTKSEGVEYVEIEEVDEENAQLVAPDMSTANVDQLDENLLPEENDDGDGVISPRTLAALNDGW